MKKTHVFILDDHKIVRDGLKSLLTIDESFKVIGEEGHPEAFLKLLPKLMIDLLILDISLPQTSGIEVLKKVKAHDPTILVVMLSMHDGPDYVLKCMREGANAYLPKDVEAPEFIEALRQVKDKGVYYPASINFNLLNELVPAPDGSRKQGPLTPKELDVLEHMARGLSSKQIAALHGLSCRTIETHRLNIMKKLGTNNSAETIALATKLNILT